MARFLGSALGRASTAYTDTRVDGVCSDLLTCVSGVNTKVDTACSNLCGYVNTVCTNIGTTKLSCNGSASNLTGLTGASAGTYGNASQVAQITVDANNKITSITNVNAGTPAGVPAILYSCSQCWNGSACIPVESRGAYRQYQIIGHTGYWVYYCSQATFDFAPWAGCSDMFSAYCCTQATCGFLAFAKCFTGSYTYGCAGAIAWPFGCSSGCLTACAVCGFQWNVQLTPENPCNASQKQFLYCFASSNGNYNCCTGIRNSGRAFNCCGGAPQCLRGVCFTTPSATNPFTCNAGITIIGYGKMPV